MDDLRISIVGNSGSGKTTVAALLARRLGIAHVELDALRHGPNWTETPDAEFRRQVAARVAGASWVVDGNYSIARDLVWARATLIVWLDPPRWVVMAQVVWRSLSRAITRRELWNGNRERISSWLRADHPIRWAWRIHARRRLEYEALLDARWVRLRSRAEVRRWVQSLPLPQETDDRGALARR